MKPVLEEPHSVPEYNPEKQSEASVSDDTYGVGFLSGLASVVQSTVSWLLCAVQSQYVHGVCSVGNGVSLH